MSSRHFTMPTVVRIGFYMLQCIESFHKHGFVHRDIKPGNFLLRMNNDKNPLALIDFGLSKRYIDQETGKPFKEKQKTGFKGTSKYASLQAQSFHDQCPRDDLISWLYSLVELIDGFLPWGSIRDNQKLTKVKIQTQVRSLFKSLPAEFYEMYKYLNNLTYLSIPHYHFLYQLLIQVYYNKLKLSPEIPFDWEKISQEKIDIYSPIPVLPNVKAIQPIPNDHEIISDDDEKEFSSNRCAACLLSYLHLYIYQYAIYIYLFVLLRLLNM